MYEHNNKRVKKDPEKYPIRRKKDLFTKELGLAMAEHFFNIAGM